MSQLSREDLGRLTDMLKYARRIEEHVRGVDYQSFKSNKLLCDGIIRCIAVVGEAAWKFSKPAQKMYPTVPWPLMATMRHRLVHDYGGTDMQTVYRVATESIPELIEQLLTILRDNDALQDG